MNRQPSGNLVRSMDWSRRSVAVRYVHPLSTAWWQSSGNRCEGLEQAADGGVAVVAGPWARDEALRRLEAVLFLAQEPLSSRKLARLAGLTDGTQARTLVRRLNRLYDTGGWAFRAEEVAGGFQLMSRPKFAPWLRRLQPAPVEVRLSPPALETLAVVAYRQPVMRAEIEAVRGVQCDEVLRQLIERDLVRVVGRSEQLGRPYLYGTTKRFLQVFGLRHLDELPQPDSWLGGAEGSTTKHPGQYAKTDEKVQVPEQEEDPVNACLEAQMGTQSQSALSVGPSSDQPVVDRSGQDDLSGGQARELDEERAYLDEDDEGYDEFDDEDDYDYDEDEEDWDEDWEEVDDEDWEEEDEEEEDEYEEEDYDEEYDEEYEDEDYDEDEEYDEDDDYDEYEDEEEE